MNIIVVRPLVDRLYDPDDPWMGNDALPPPPLPGPG